MAETETGAQRPMGDAIGRYAAIITTVVGLVVTVNTAVTSCSRERVANAAGFRAAVKVEEDYWAGLYQQYVATVGQAGQDDRARSARLLAISQLATHAVPDFSEYSLGPLGGTERQAAARAQLLGLQRNLQKSLTNELSSGPVVARNAEFIFANDTETRERDHGRVTEAAREATESQIVNASTGPEASYATRTLSSGTPTGWDIDVFWCAGQAEADRYARASRIAAELARLSRSGYSKNGFSIGRVRLRTLPAEQQAIPGKYVSNTDAVVADAGPGESAAAKQVVDLIRSGIGLPLAKGTSAGSLTRWYLSVFTCSGTPSSRGAAQTGSRTAVSVSGVPDSTVAGTINGSVIRSNR